MIVGLAGPKGAGKSTLASKLTEHFPNSIVLPFAGPLKAMAEAFYAAAGFDAEDVQRRVYGDRKEMYDALGDALVTPRRVMQTLGTEWGRDCIHSDLWVQLWLERALKEEKAGRLVIADDVRFDNEARVIHAMPGGLVFRFNGPAADDTGHASEGGVNVWDHMMLECRSDAAAGLVVRLIKEAMAGS
jgi:energy-coupling factor transporter ATP-binding protein EcfA2